MYSLRTYIRTFNKQHSSSSPEGLSLVQHYSLLVYTRTAAAIQQTSPPLLVRKSAVTLLWYTAASTHSLCARPSKQQCYRITILILVRTSSSAHQQLLQVTTCCVRIRSKQHICRNAAFCFVRHYYILVYVSNYSSSSTTHQHYDSYVHQQQHIHTT